MNVLPKDAYIAGGNYRYRVIGCLYTPADEDMPVDCNFRDVTPHFFSFTLLKTPRYQVGLKLEIISTGVPLLDDCYTQLSYKLVLDSDVKSYKKSTRPAGGIVNWHASSRSLRRSPSRRTDQPLLFTSRSDGREAPLAVA